ncbi:MAG: hypothetical protein M1829_003842 [Trizodia sp. TS-e1964]|nr:MAG: hypothetical protein M1829_003842 [Trizodia sp. TS-e1964]
MTSPRNLRPPGLELDEALPGPSVSWKPFSRSPHPYHRRKLVETSRHSNSPSGDEAPTSSDSGRGNIRRLSSKSTTDSGTEADDEGLIGLLKRLPAPPVRPSKGLRAGSRTLSSGSLHTPSPLLTPACLDEEDPGRLLHLGADGQTYALNGNRFDNLMDGQAKVVALERFQRRRRAELIRRAVETSITASIGGALLWRTTIAQKWVYELLIYLTLLFVLAALYPVRLLLYPSSGAEGRKNTGLARIRIPSAFDPAPLLYPIFLPVYTALALLPAGLPLLVPNLVLGLSALPEGLVAPLASRRSAPGSGWYVVHWVLSITPVALAALLSGRPDRLTTPAPLSHPSSFSDPAYFDKELLIFLYPLHQALLPPLYCLTTTSLLSAELHLLSISLINLLLFAHSPQATILKALLWGGGLGVLLLCSHVLCWGVQLARIPRWKFRRSVQVAKARNSFWQVLYGRVLGRKNIRLFSGQKGGGESDADEDAFLLPGLRRGRGKRSLSVKVEDNSLSKEPLDESSFPPPRRRHTLPTINRSFSPLRLLRATQKKWQRQSRMQPYLDMTAAQANTRKWVYAVYVYLVVLALAMGGIRRYVAAYALSCHEPVGWAIGYLLGNIQPLRLYLVAADLERWVCLPARSYTQQLELDPDPELQLKLGRVETWRIERLGAANTRLLLSGYCLVVLALGMATVLQLSAVVAVDTRRKVFHGMMVAMFLPSTFVDPAFAALALTLILAAFLLLDLFRAAQLPPLSRPLACFLTPYVDGRDLRGPVVVSHIFLLIGCAIPLWLSLARVPRTGEGCWAGWEVPARDVGMVSGVVCVGMGDAAASLVGRRFGRRKWPWAGGKSLEGSAAFVAAAMLGICAGKTWLRMGGWQDNNDDRIGQTVWKAGVAAAGASLTESVLTGGNDNVIVPVVLWLLATALDI